MCGALFDLRAAPYASPALSKNGGRRVSSRSFRFPLMGNALCKTGVSERERLPDICTEMLPV